MQPTPERTGIDPDDAHLIDGFEAVDEDEPPRDVAPLGHPEHAPARRVRRLDLAGWQLLSAPDASPWALAWAAERAPAGSDLAAALGDLARTGRAAVREDLGSELLALLDALARQAGCSAPAVAVCPLGALPERRLLDVELMGRDVEQPVYANGHAGCGL